MALQVLCASASRLLPYLQGVLGLLEADPRRYLVLPVQRSGMQSQYPIVESSSHVQQLELVAFSTCCAELLMQMSLRSRFLVVTCSPWPQVWSFDVQLLPHQLTCSMNAP